MDFDVEDNEEQEEKVKKNKLKIDKGNLFIYIGIGAVVVLILLILILSSLKNKKQQTNQQIKEPVVIKKQEQPESQLNIINENSNERPVAIVVDNNINNIKHAGLQESYVNYEIIIDGGITRILAIYKDANVGIIGPVRDIKSYFIDYALEHDAIIGHFGTTDEVEKELNELNIPNINAMKNTSAFAQDKSLESPHNVFTSTTKIREFIEKSNGNVTSESWKVFNYSSTDFNLVDKDIRTAIGEPEKLINAEKVVLNYSQDEVRTYKYSSENKYYLREKNGVSELDRVTNNQLHYKNIIIMKVENQPNSEGKQELKTVGTGTGYYITNGTGVEITWSKQSKNAKTKYTYANGTEIELNDGNTFVQIVPISSQVTIGRNE